MQRPKWPFPAETKNLYTKMPMPPDPHLLKEATEQFVINPEFQRTMIDALLTNHRVTHQSKSGTTVYDPDSIVIANFNPESSHTEQILDAILSWYTMSYVSRTTPTEDKHDSSLEDRQAGRHYFYVHLLDCHWTFRLVINTQNVFRPTMKLFRLSQQAITEIDWRKIFIFMTTRCQLPNLTGAWRKLTEKKDKEAFTKRPTLSWPVYSLVSSHSEERPETTINICKVMHISEGTQLPKDRQLSLPLHTNEYSISLTLSDAEVMKVAIWGEPPPLDLPDTRSRRDKAVLSLRRHIKMYTIPLIEEEYPSKIYPTPMIYYAAKWSLCEFPQVALRAHAHDKAQLKKIK